MSDKLVDMQDLRFLLYEVFDIEELTKYKYFEDHSRETFDMAIDTAYDLAREVLWPGYQECDRIGAQFDGEKTTVPQPLHDMWKAFQDGGWFAPGTTYENGGQQFPYAVYCVAAFMFNAANTCAAMYFGQATGAAHLIDSFGTKEQKRLYMAPLFAGEWGGTMALTEPQAGTSLSDIATTAVKADDGDYYLIKGVKRFISSGDQDLTPNIIHPTLARIEGAPPGIKGVSLFIVPKYRVNDDGSVGEFNDVTTGGIEHKMGLKAQATATLNYGEKDSCRGYLLGEENQGLKCMFELMNTARIHTGIQAIGQASCAYQCALQYCRERLQGREVTERDVTTPQIPIIKHAAVRAMLVQQKAYVEGVMGLLLYCGQISDLERVAESEEERENWRQVLEILTPVCKAYGSDIAFESINLALQCYGGAGYIEEYPIAQLLRDNRVFSVYEGTNEIQAMDLLGRKVSAEQGAYFRTLLAEVGKTLAEAAEVEALAGMTEQLNKAMEELIQVTTHLGGIGLGGDIDLYISYATPYLRIFSQFVVSWQFLIQSIAAQRGLDSGTGDSNFYQGKLATARYYLSNTLPSGSSIAQAILANERTAYDFDEAWFGGAAVDATV